MSAKSVHESRHDPVDYAPINHAPVNHGYGVLLAGGDAAATDDLRELTQKAVYVVAADSGLKHAKALGVRPDVIVGDFDSVTDDVLAAYRDIAQVRHPPEKDWLDLELALHHLQDKGLTHIVIVGGFGSRLDQSLAALLIAARQVQQGLQVRFHSGERQAFVVAEGQQLSLPVAEGRTFSVLSLLNEARVSVSGAKYPLAEAVLEFGVGLGVSNIVTSTTTTPTASTSTNTASTTTAQTTTVTVHEGLVAIIVEDDAAL